MDKDEMNEEELFCKLFPDYAVNGNPLSPYFDFFESGYEQAENRIEELEKENANLKEELKKWKDEWQEQVQEATNEGFARILQTTQLTKAKDIIKKFLEFVNNDVEYDPEHPQEHTDLWNELCEQAEQFLNSDKPREEKEERKYYCKTCRDLMCPYSGTERYEINCSGVEED